MNGFHPFLILSPSISNYKLRH
ncbi:Protein CBG27507 [Caenorhabditis briggsae]|uniref:Protein CBG27507 n=1 Tax=Caenorhabditis briggsae TaxID=6238 RepID=B6IF22_CAEBR|nr:Protein CBG27507 [Caenorhabditis briggsae]CAR98502.1 Protein CBG27507 [Caenorhabditis briggsae]